MAAEPKRKISTYRKGKRIASRKKKLPRLVKCKNCGSKKISHHKCANCDKK